MRASGGGDDIGGGFNIHLTRATCDQARHGWILETDAITMSQW
jgi:hypothetical protein